MEYVEEGKVKGEVRGGGGRDLAHSKNFLHGAHYGMLCVFAFVSFVNIPVLARV